LVGVANPTPAFTFNKVVTAAMITLEGVDTDDVISSSYEPKATNILRSDRVRSLDAYNSEHLDSPMLMREEYWQDTTNIWQTNMIDGYTATTLSFSAELPVKKYKEVSVNNFMRKLELQLKASNLDNSGSTVTSTTVSVWLRCYWTELIVNPKRLANLSLRISDSNKIVHLRGGF
jgi:hypothetical protein